MNGVVGVCRPRTHPHHMISHMTVAALEPAMSLHRDWRWERRALGRPGPVHGGDDHGGMERYVDR